MKAKGSAHLSDAHDFLISVTRSGMIGESSGACLFAMFSDPVFSQSVKIVSLCPSRFCRRTCPYRKSAFSREQRQASAAQTCLANMPKRRVLRIHSWRFLHEPKLEVLCRTVQCSAPFRFAVFMVRQYDTERVSTVPRHKALCFVA